MPFENGHDKSTGRPKGSGNKDLQPIRDAFRKLVESNLTNMTKWLEEVAEDNPQKALDIIQGLAEFTIPKLARTELAVDADTIITPILFVDGQAISRSRSNGDIPKK